MGQARAFLSFTLLLLVAIVARAVPLPDSGTTTLPGTTAAARPELAGVVLQDVLFEYRLVEGTRVIAGVLQSSVVRSNRDGTLDFYWRVLPSPDSNGSVAAARVTGFGGLALDADWRIDGLGNEFPHDAQTFGTGNVTFLFSTAGGNPGIGNNDSSRFFFIRTTATDYTTAGGFELFCSNIACEQTRLPTFAPAVNPTREAPLISMTTVPATLVEGQPATFRVAVQSQNTGSPVPTGRVQLLDGGVSGAASNIQDLDATGAATFSLPALASGNHFYFARYAGDSLYTPAASAGFTLNRAGDVILARCPSDPRPGFIQCVNQPDRLSATVLPRGGFTPTGSVTLARGSQVLETVQLVNGRADFAPTTPQSDLLVNYSGDPNYPRSTSKPLSDAIRIGDLVLTSEPFPATVGTATRFTATSIGGSPVPNATYTFFAGASQIGGVSDSVRGSAQVDYTPSGGDSTVRAVRTPADGAADYVASSEVAQMVSERITPTVRLTTPQFPLVAGRPATFEIAVQGSGTAAATGAVELRDGSTGGTVVGSSTLDAAGAATITLQAVPPGNHFYVASYAGDALHTSALSGGLTVNSTGNVILARCPPGAGFPLCNEADAATKLVATVLFRGTVVPTGTVTPRDRNTAYPPVTLQSGRADLVLPESVDVASLRVDYSGDSNYPASVSNTLNADRADDTIYIGDVVLTSEPSPAQVNSPAVLTATTISGLPVPNGAYTFAVDGRTVATLFDSSGVGSVSITYTPQTGEKVIGVTRSADATYGSSREATQLFTPDITGGGSGGGGGDGGGGCFIATAAYGSYLHPHVQTLRRFRDRVLMTTSAGRAVVAAYYRVSPTLARVIERDPDSRAAARVVLTPVVFVVAFPGPAFAIVLLLMIVLRKSRARRATPHRW